jgi:hypothetical protein
MSMHFLPVGIYQYHNVNFSINKYVIYRLTNVTDDGKALTMPYGTLHITHSATALYSCLSWDWLNWMDTNGMVIKMSVPQVDTLII